MTDRPKKPDDDQDESLPSDEWLTPPGPTAPQTLRTAPRRTASGSIKAILDDAKSQPPPAIAERELEPWSDSTPPPPISSIPAPISSRGGVHPDIPSYSLFLWRIIKTAFDSTWRYYAWMTSLTILALVGLHAWAQQLGTGMTLTNMSDHVSWGFYIANFTFAVGLAAGAVMMVIPAYVYDDHEMHDVVIIGELIAIASIVVALAFVIVDMGRPDRLWHILPVVGRMNFPRSMLAWDVVVLNGYLLLNLHIAGYLLYMRFLGRKPAKIWYVPFVFLSIGWALSVHAVTAFLYAGLGGRPFWNSALLAPRFIVTAFVSGPAFVILLLMVIRQFSAFKIADGPLRTLHQVLRITVVANLFMFGSELFTAFYSGSSHAAPMHYLLLGHGDKMALVPWIWSALALNCVSAFLLYTRKAVTDKRVLAVACLASFGGIWIEKGMGLIVPAFVPSTLHEYVEYTPSVTEWKISVGIWAVGFLVLTVAVKVALRVLTGRVAVDTYAHSIPPPPAMPKRSLRPSALDL